uniref:Ras-GEF domain-containing protein n=1 Tax=Trichuris muris TaxID=70415 RepID=A0A5S6QUE2_TRIMR
MTTLKTKDSSGLARSFKRIIRLHRAGSATSISTLPEEVHKAAMKHAISEKSLRDRVKLGKSSMKQIAAILMDKSTRTVDRVLPKGRAEENCSTNYQVAKEMHSKQLAVCLQYLKDAMHKKNLALLAGSTCVVLDVIMKITTEKRISKSVNDQCKAHQRICLALNELMNKVDSVLVTGKIVEADCELVAHFAQALHAVVQELCVQNGSELVTYSGTPVAPRRKSKVIKKSEQEELGKPCNLATGRFRYFANRRQDADKQSSRINGTREMELPFPLPNKCHETTPGSVTEDSGIYSFNNGSESLLTLPIISPSNSCTTVVDWTGYGLNRRDESFESPENFLKSSSVEDYVHKEYSKNTDDQMDGEETFSETRVGNTVVKVKKVRKKQVLTTMVVKKSERIVPLCPELSQEAYNFYPELSTSLTENALAGGIDVIETEVRCSKGLRKTEYKSTSAESGVQTFLSMESDLDMANDHPEASSGVHQFKSTCISGNKVHIKHFDQSSDHRAVSRKVYANGKTEILSTDERSRKLELSKRSAVFHNDSGFNIEEEHFSSESNTFEVNECDDGFTNVNFRDLDGSAKASMHSRKTDVVSSYMQLFGNSQHRNASDFRTSAMVGYEMLRERWLLHLTSTKQYGSQITHASSFKRSSELMELLSFPFKRRFVLPTADTYPHKLALTEGAVKEPAHGGIVKSDDDDECSIKGGVIDALIAYAVTSDSNEEGFLFKEAFLTTYRSFVPSVELLEKLIHCFHGQSRSHSAESQQKLANYFSFIVRVVDDLTILETTAQAMTIITEFIRELTTGRQLAWARLLRQKFVEKYGNLIASRQLGIDRPLFCRSNSRSSKSSSILNFKSAAIAHQMTFLDWFYFHKIELSEMLLWSISQDETKCPNLTVFTNHFNKVSYWIRTRIMEPTDQREREKCFLKFVKIMRHLRRMGNLNSCLAVLAALDCGPLRRLDWPSSAVNQLADYSALIDSSQSFKAYRAVLADTKPPCLPYLGLILQDLTFVHVGNPDYLQQNENLTAKVINFTKRWQQFMILDNVRRFKFWAYDISPDDGILTFFDNFDNYIEEEQIWELSEKIKPRHSASKPVA